jgi:hypothetical protein
MRVVPIFEAENEADNIAMRPSNKLKSASTDEPEEKRIQDPSAETVLPAVSKKRKITDGDDEHLASKRSKVETEHGAANMNLCFGRVPESDLSAETALAEPIASLFGDPRPPTSLKRKADDDMESEVAFNKRTKNADNADNTDTVTTLVPVSGRPIPVDPSVDPKDIFPFLLLPAEIRLQIYALLFKLRRPVYPRVGIAAHDKGTRSGFRKGLVRSMVLANRKLSREVTHFIYSNNCFRLTLRWHRDWVTRIGRKNSRLVQEVILIGSGRDKLAAEYLYFGIVTLWKRACANLRRITVQDDWRTLDSAFVVQQLVDFGAKLGWRRFTNLEHIGIDVPHVGPPHRDRRLYDQLFQQSGVSLTARHYVDRWDEPLQQTERGWRAKGLVWLDVTVTKEERQRIVHEEKKRMARLRRAEKREARRETKAKAWVEAEFAKR